MEFFIVDKHFKDYIIEIAKQAGNGMSRRHIGSEKAKELQTVKYSLLYKYSLEADLGHCNNNYQYNEIILNAIIDCSLEINCNINCYQTIIVQY